MMLYCSFCGNPIEENATFCPNCGSHVEESNQNSAKTSSSQPQIITDVPSSSLPQQQPSYRVQPVYKPVVTYQPVQTTYHAPPPSRSNSEANNALVLSLVGLFCIPVIPSIFALIYGIRASKSPYNRGTAIVAVILAVIGIVPYTVVLFMFLFLWW
ncbi:MAG: zinc-ribbon domain-containing protein [Candidatus Heimdallarchaeota archaeon]